MLPQMQVAGKSVELESLPPGMGGYPTVGDQLMEVASDVEVLLLRPGDWHITKGIHPDRGAFRAMKSGHPLRYYAAPSLPSHLRGLGTQMGDWWLTEDAQCRPRVLLLLRENTDIGLRTDPLSDSRLF